ncbi:splicing regulator SDE2 isoform X1 [Amphiprion ocellaris]|uniref:splicing regulator SDE2 isoform X1 n=1 Tax=Amphiprion ocellaris TaxID=80972 RepID=UPI002410E4F1|nr:splicing regulator SDE2 isoform X1 [Amphiprion ocellaris]
MEVSVGGPSFRSSSFVFPDGSVVGDLLTRFVQQQDFYVVRNGRRSDLQDPLQHGSVYHLEPRLKGGKGGESSRWSGPVMFELQAEGKCVLGFGSMLRALGAQIEKTTNREACRDLSGRRLRDVNHEKEMAEWLKQQAEREAEKEQRRLERLQRKLSEPKHQFSDPEYQRQCHDLSERLEDSVLKGLQASSSSQVRMDAVSAAKRPNQDQIQQPPSKKKKEEEKMAGFWTGVGDLEELLSSEDEDEESPSTSSSSFGAAAVTMTTHRQEAEPESSDSSSPESGSSSENQRPLESCRDQRPPESCRDQKPPEPCRPSGSQQVDLSSVSSVQQLESLGLDVLKEELMSRGLKCGGTLSERAARLFSVRGLSPDQIDPVLLAKPGKSRRK